MLALRSHAAAAPVPKSVVVSLRDLDGSEVLLKENVIFSSKLHQPIRCYERLMEHGLGINGREQTFGEW